MEIFTYPGFIALLQVIGIDLVLAGDNAIVIGLAAAGLPKDLRTKAILVGILAATVLRICFALVTTHLMALTGLVLAGGILLLWVCWKMWRELREQATQDQAEATAMLDGGEQAARKPKTYKVKGSGSRMEALAADEIRRARELRRAHERELLALVGALEQPRHRGRRVCGARDSLGRRDRQGLCRAWYQPDRGDGPAA